MEARFKGEADHDDDEHQTSMSKSPVHEHSNRLLILSTLSELDCLVLFRV